MPIIQGYIQIEECKIQVDNDIQGVAVTPKFETFKLCLISRRSRFRAGTRYDIYYCKRAHRNVYFFLGIIEEVSTNMVTAQIT